MDFSQKIHKKIVKSNAQQVGKMKKENVKKTEENATYIANLLQKRVYSAYTKGRSDQRDTYEHPLTKREWWRVLVKETPVPGTYATRDFLDVANMKPVQATYNFQGQGREKEAGISRKGELLLPGAYQQRDFIDDLKKRRAASSFKSSGRTRTPPGFRDKDLNVPPWQYNLSRAPVEKLSSKHSAFKSQSSRFPSLPFRPKEGPPPGAYNPCQPSYRYKVSSSFRSNTARFGSSHTKVPGSGTYHPVMCTKPQVPTLKKMARMHGLFFRTTFEI